MEGLVVLILVFWVVPIIVKALKGGKGKARQSGQTDRPAAQRQTPSVELHRPVPSMKRPPVNAASRSAKRDFRAPEAPCIVCENTGEDHFQRDKARRIAQLDDWLKNGIIDREEYRVMKDRYQRGI